MTVTISAAHLETLHAWANVSPLLSAVFAPFSVLFEIPAVTEPWFIKFDPNVLLSPNKANSIPDAPGNIVLSALGLAFNVLANVLLIFRFSSGASWWRLATRLSVLSWLLKVIIALVNICFYGRLPPNATRGEGFWCAMVSLIICGLITIFLVFHWAMEMRKRPAHYPTEDQIALRIAGRHFMANITLFVIVLGIFALISSRVEDWTYLQGIYFTIITFLTVGFGDFVPTHTVLRVLLFFFSVFAIAQLGNIISMIVQFFSSRTQERRAMSQARFEKRRYEQELSKYMKTKHNSTNGHASPSVSQETASELQKEIEFLHRVSAAEQARIRMGQVAGSLTGLLIFWVVGAAIFSRLEGWSYGIGMYFIYVAFLTIGYGDYAPITPAGRVVFVLYSLMAVPIMASFAVQAVQQAFSAVAERQYNRKKVKLGLRPAFIGTSSQSTSAGKKFKKSLSLVESRIAPQGVKLLRRTKSLNSALDLNRDAEKSTQKSGIDNAERIISHAELAEDWHKKWEERVSEHYEEEGNRRKAEQMANEDIENEEARMTNDRPSTRSKLPHNISKMSKNDNPSIEDQFDEDERLTEQVLEFALSIEWRARRLLIAHLDGGNEAGDGGGHAARLILKADHNIQIRAMKRLLHDIEIQEENRVNNHGDASYSSHSFIGKLIQRMETNSDVSQDPDNEKRTLEEVRLYREEFAGLLAAGGKLMKLKGMERSLFERRQILQEN